MHPHPDGGGRFQSHLTGPPNPFKTFSTDDGGRFGDHQASTATAAGFDSRALRQLNVIFMNMTMTKAQKQRLLELGLAPSEIGRDHESAEQRDAQFTEIETRLVERNRGRISGMLEHPARNRVRILEASLAERLVSRGFQEMSTPHIINRDALARMGIHEGDPLFGKVFWLDGKRCLRPMLAPGLYVMMRVLRRSYRAPLRLFEVGPCYRRESHGNKHLEQFTMLNLIEAGPAAGASRLREMIGEIMGAAGTTYELTEEVSVVYGTTIDVMVNGFEVASCSTGPHPLDRAHGIDEPWAGIGLGLERLILATQGEANIKRIGGSLVYLEGVRADL